MYQDLVSKIAQHAAAQPNKTCITFTTVKGDQHITYRQLHERAQKVAVYLRHRFAPQDCILLVYPSGIDFVVAWLGCVYASMIAVPMMPPNNNQKLMVKSLNIIANAKPKLALISELLNKDENQEFNGVKALTLAELGDENIEDFRTNLKLEDVAFLQYTSGSTGSPKGVIITNANLADNLALLGKASDLDVNNIACSWLPPHHDMGLMGFILSPLYTGNHTILIPPFQFLQNPLFWLKTITKYGVNFSGGPNFGFDYCVRRIKDNQKVGLDLRSWRSAPNGAEPVRRDTLEKFYQAFKNYGFEIDAFGPCYGLAESTVLVSKKAPHDKVKHVCVDKHFLKNNQIVFVQDRHQNAYSLVSCGRLYQDVEIINPDTLIRCGENEVGEIWVQGASVGKGYWQNPEATAETFHARFVGQTAPGEYLRTGDLGFLCAGELYITGRIKDLLIFYGSNHYPQDIEKTLIESDFAETIGRVAAYSLSDDSREILGIMIEARTYITENNSYDETVDKVRKLVMSVHQLEVEDIAFIPYKKMPFTTSGKIRRRECVQNFETQQIPILYRWRKNSVMAVTNV